MAGQKIRIRLKAYDHEAIDASARKIVETVTRTGARVVLVGSSAGRPGGDDELGRTLDRFEAQKATYRYESCDISNAEAVRALVARIRKEMGPITGVVQGAGVLKAGRIQSMTAAAAATARLRVVLPAPPGPTSVTRREPARRSVTDSSSASRPIGAIRRVGTFDDGPAPPTGLVRSTEGTGDGVTMSVEAPSDSS